jgi:DNA-binding CsgD family transcriptional regulator
LDRDRDNLRTALDWLIQEGRTSQALELAGSLWQFWWWRSHVTEGRRLLVAALALPGAEAATTARAMALTGAGALAETLGDYAEAEIHYEAALACWNELDDARGRGLALLFRWLLAFNAARDEDMLALATESLAFFERLGDQWGVAMSHMELGIGLMGGSELKLAAKHLETGRELFQQLGDAWGAALCQGSMGNIRVKSREFAAGALLLRASLDDLLLIDDRWGIATVLLAAARLAMERRDFERAVRNSSAAASLHETLRTPLKPPFRKLFEDNLQTARAAFGEPAFAAAWLAGQSWPLPDIVALAIADGAESSRAAVSRLLTPRELDVLRLSAKHRTDPQIGTELFISKRTVSTHMEHIIAKLGVSSRHEAGDVARGLGIL